MELYRIFVLQFNNMEYVEQDVKSKVKKDEIHTKTHEHKINS